ALVGVVLLALVLRLVVGLLRRSPLPEPDAHHVTAALADESVDAPTMLDGIARAQRLLDEERAPRDAIVQAWLALEHAASRAGVGRRPAQTPTEFSAVVLERTPADRDAVEVLRALYLRVRFSDDELLPGDAEAARQALTAIGASWAELTEAAPLRGLAGCGSASAPLSWRCGSPSPDSTQPSPTSAGCCWRSG